jgi:DUF1009 family protein
VSKVEQYQDRESGDKLTPALAQRVALIAGNGQYPIDFAKKAQSLGRELTIIGFEGETSDEISKYSRYPVYWIKVGQLSKLLKILSQSGSQQAAFAGGVSRVRLFRNFWPDMKALTLTAKLGTIKDDVILRALAQEVEALGIKVINAASYIDDAVPKPGLLSARDLTIEERADAAIGWKTAKLVGESDVGQSVVVYKSLVIAVEAVEGTDETIKRAGKLSNLSGSSPGKNGAVLIKICKPHQDRRLDLPSFGPKTIEEMKHAGLTAAVLEAEASLIINPGQTIDLANKYGIALYAAVDETSLLKDQTIERDFNLSL